jgi:hypothetical protein
MNNIYIIGDGENIKIGVSKNPQRRLKTLQTGHPHKLTLLFSIPSPSAYKIEKQLHKMLTDFRVKKTNCVRSEWFCLKDRDYNWLYSYITELSKQDNSFYKINSNPI